MNGKKKKDTNRLLAILHPLSAFERISIAALTFPECILIAGAAERPQWTVSKPNTTVSERYPPPTHTRRLPLLSEPCTPDQITLIKSLCRVQVVDLAIDPGDLGDGDDAGEIDADMAEYLEFKRYKELQRKYGDRL